MTGSVFAASSAYRARDRGTGNLIGLNYRSPDGCRHRCDSLSRHRCCSSSIKDVPSANFIMMTSLHQIDMDMALVSTRLRRCRVQSKSECTPSAATVRVAVRSTVAFVSSMMLCWPTSASACSMRRRGRAPSSALRSHRSCGTQTTRKFQTPRNDIPSLSSVGVTSSRIQRDRLCHRTLQGYHRREDHPMMIGRSICVDVDDVLLLCIRRDW